MLRRITIVTALLGAAAVFGTTAPAFAATVIGQNAMSSGIGCGGATRIQTSVSSGASFAVPAGNWLLTSWSTLVGGPGNQMAAVVVRPTGTPGQYTVVAVTPTQTLTANTLNTFSTSVVVQGGDLLGLWGSGSSNCVLSTGNGGDGQAWTGGSAPVAGSTLTLTGYSGYILNISASLSPIAPPVVRSPDSMFLCYSKFEQDGGAVFEAGQAQELLAGGYWLPSAVAGVVPGGTNLGAYHLDCNPPATLKPTAAYVGDGGDVVSEPGTAQPPGYYPILA